MVVDLTQISDIKDKIDLVEYVSKHVTLQKSGQNFKANCPFHQEKTPSFYVFPDKQTWRCFGACADGGDVFNFVMKVQNFEFSAALQQLADETGVVLRARDKEQEETSSTLKSINQIASEFFSETLLSPQGKGVMEYLSNRNIDSDTIESFGLGFSLSDNKTLTNRLLDIGHKDEDLISAGICRRNDMGQLSEVFRGRLMIPIRIRNGDIAGFGARTLDNRQPKYLNSPQTPIFDKSRILYGIDKAYRTIQKDNTVVVVEGYMDAIRAHKHGYSNVVASMGTALTSYQVDQIKVMAENVIMALDSDAAGQQATIRNLDSSWKVFQNGAVAKRNSRDILRSSKNPVIKIASMPNGEDPDDVINRSTEEWDKIVEHAKPMFSFLMESLGDMHGKDDARSKTQLVESLAPIIFSVSDPIEQEEYVESLREYLEVKETTLLAALRNAREKQTSRGPRYQKEVEIADNADNYISNDPLEAFCLKILLNVPNKESYMEHIKEEYFNVPENKTILSMISQNRETELAKIESGEVLNAISYINAQNVPPMNIPDQGQALRQTINRLEDRYLKNIKSEEELMFSQEAFTDFDSQSESILKTNERIKYNQTNKLRDI